MYGPIIWIGGAGGGGGNLGNDGLQNRFQIIPQRFPHADGADLGDNYISGISDGPGMKKEADDIFMAADPQANHNHAPDVSWPPPQIPPTSPLPKSLRNRCCVVVHF